jgi:hypothetical protein
MPKGFNVKQAGHLTGLFYGRNRIRPKMDDLFFQQ